MVRSCPRPLGAGMSVLLLVIVAIQGAQAQKKAEVGVYYATWFNSENSWQDKSMTPLLGHYNSADETLISRHHDWLKCAGVDFIVIDWSNNIECAHLYATNPARSTCFNHFKAIEDATVKVFDVFKKKGGVKVAIMIGSPANPNDYRGGGRMRVFGNKVWDMFAGNPQYSDTYYKLKGKPLLADYLGTPIPYGVWGKVDPDWDDTRFSVRHITGFLSDQPFVLNGDKVKTPHIWSWEDRNKNVFSTNPDGSLEAAVVTAANRGDCIYGFGNPPGNPWGCPRGLQTRRGGKTFLERWDRAIAAGVEIVMVQSWNEFMRSGGQEELDAERSNDIEPTKELGLSYLQALAANVAKYKSSRGVKVVFCDAINKNPVG